MAIRETVDHLVEMLRRDAAATGVDLFLDAALEIQAWFNQRDLIDDHAPKTVHEYVVDSFINLLDTGWSNYWEDDELRELLSFVPEGELADAVKSIGFLSDIHEAAYVAEQYVDKWQEDYPNLDDEGDDLDEVDGDRGRETESEDDSQHDYFGIYDDEEYGNE